MVTKRLSGGHKRRCDFALAIVKGLVEHDDGHAYFGSLGGYSLHEADAMVRGYVVLGPKICRDGTHEFTIETTRLTEAGRKVYDDLHLARLPQAVPGRAYAWNWDVIDEV